MHFEQFYRLSALLETQYKKALSDLVEIYHESKIDVRQEGNALYIDTFFDVFAVLPRVIVRECGLLLEIRFCVMIKSEEVCLGKVFMNNHGGVSGDLENLLFTPYSKYALYNFIDCFTEMNERVGGEIWSKNE